ncbi:MAG: hypothetical protein QNK04_28845 [Myxococcota bacterium]|nr:hypothetical protein [Myxococcota bacterium]
MTRTTFLAALFLATLCLAPTGARADEPGEGVPTAPFSMLQPQVAGRYEPPSDEFSGLSAEEDWQRRRLWRYGDQQLFALTRGLEEAGVPKPARWALYPFTGAFDVGNAVFSAIGGLYGD